MASLLGGQRVLRAGSLDRAGATIGALLEVDLEPGGLVESRLIEGGVRFIEKHLHNLF